MMPISIIPIATASVASPCFTVTSVAAIKHGRIRAGNFLFKRNPESAWVGGSRLNQTLPALICTREGREKCVKARLLVVNFSADL
jgi:hypothetical protein